MAQDILIVDDEADIRHLIAGILQDEGYQTREAAESDAALAQLRHRRPHLLILDIWLQNSALDGMGLLEISKRDYPELPVIMISGHGNIETAVNAIKNGAYDFIEKPFKADRLLVIIERALEAARLRRENDELRARSGTETELIGVLSGRDSIAAGDRAGGADRQPRPAFRSGRQRQGGRGPHAAPAFQARRGVRSSWSTARPCIPTGWKSSCSASSV